MGHEMIEADQLTTIRGNNMPTRKSPTQLRMQATMNAGGL